MTNEEAVKVIKSECYVANLMNLDRTRMVNSALDVAIKALEQQPIDKSAMMYEIYMNGVNMSGEYQGCWVRFKDIEKIVDKYIEGSDS